MRQTHVTEIPHGLYIQTKQCCDKTLYSLKLWKQVVRVAKGYLVISLGLWTVMTICLMGTRYNFHNQSDARETNRFLDQVAGLSCD